VIMPANDSLMRFGAYVKALELFDLVVADMASLTPHRQCERLASQQLASADSIAANIEEGYGRGSKKEYCQFLVISRGSARETSGRYRRLRHWLPSDVIQKRGQLCDEIIGILTSSIQKLRSQLNPAVASAPPVTLTRTRPSPRTP
jgi:four helix bundle protein